MACGCRPLTNEEFLWVPPGESAESDNTKLYPSEIQARAKVMRKGGSYIPLVKQPNGTHIVRRD